MKNYKDYMDNVSVSAELHEKILAQTSKALEKAEVSERTRENEVVLTSDKPKRRFSPVYAFTLALIGVLGFSAWLIAGEGLFSDDDGLITPSTETRENNLQDWQGSGETYAEFLERLIANTISYEEVIDEEYNGDGWLSVKGERALVSGGILEIYEYASSEEADLDASYISLDGCGFSVPGREITVDFVNHPHWFKHDDALMFYIGGDDQLVNFLRLFYGDEFAGYNAANGYEQTTMTAEELRWLANKSDLKEEDFRMFIGQDFGSGISIMHYNVEDASENIGYVAYNMFTFNAEEDGGLASGVTFTKKYTREPSVDIRKAGSLEALEEYLALPPATDYTEYDYLQFGEIFNRGGKGNVSPDGRYIFYNFKAPDNFNSAGYYNPIDQYIIADAQTHEIYDIFSYSYEVESFEFMWNPNGDCAVLKLESVPNEHTPILLVAEREKGIYRNGYLWDLYEAYERLIEQGAQFDFRLAEYGEEGWVENQRNIFPLTWEEDGATLACRYEWLDAEGIAQTGTLDYNIYTGEITLTERD